MNLKIKTTFFSYRSESNWLDGVWKQRHKAYVVVSIPFTPMIGMSMGDPSSFTLDQIHWANKGGIDFEAYTDVCYQFNHHLLYPICGTYTGVVTDIAKEIKNHTFEICQSQLQKTGSTWVITNEPEENVTKTWTDGLRLLRKREETEQKCVERPDEKQKEKKPWKIW